MTLFDFQLLPQTEQLDLLYEQGTYVGKRKTGAQTCILYQLEGFYVEVIYRQYRRVVDKLHCFRAMSLLDPYLELIDVEHLVD
ncbi:MAG: hypothetical protein EOP50_07850 [Sphingobacteriales bacterium]|nr:MAG: hypothetical protein EOP50_07850 [Sphingobacteriales bacterium]